MGDLLQFNKDKTKPDHDAMRQVSRSETPSGLNEAIKHIARAQVPNHFWHHACPEHKMATIRLIDGQICPDCHIDQDYIYHSRDPVA